MFHNSNMLVRLLPCCFLALVPFAASAAPIDLYDFNVVALGNIGSAAQTYGSDYQGKALVAGSAYFSGFSLHEVASAGPNTPFSLYAGGQVQISGSIKNGGIEAAGNVAVNAANIEGNIVSGGNLTGTSGTVAGNVTLAGVRNTQNVTVNGTVQQNTPFTASFDYGRVAQSFISSSQSIRNLAATGTFNNNFGNLQVTASSGINVINISAADLQAAHTVTITGPANATVYFNVAGANVTLDSTTWLYQGGLSARQVLLNYSEATVLTLSSGNSVNILAPLADTFFSSGLVTGNLIVHDLRGSGQVNAARFGGTLLYNNGPLLNTAAVPEPTSLLLFCLGLLAAGSLRGKRRFSLVA